MLRPSLLPAAALLSAFSSTLSAQPTASRIEVAGEALQMGCSVGDQHCERDIGFRCAK